MSNRFQVESFAALLRDTADERLTSDSGAFISRLEAHASETEATAKGTFSVAVGVRVDEKGEVFVVVEAPKMKTPAPPVTAAKYYTDTNDDGETVLSKRDPKQREPN